MPWSPSPYYSREASPGAADAPGDDVSPRDDARVAAIAPTALLAAVAAPRAVTDEDACGGCLLDLVDTPPSPALTMPGSPWLRR